MKYLTAFLLIIFALNSQCQKIYFPKTDFSDSSGYEKGIMSLSALVIPAYTNNDRAAYYNDLFRFYFAGNDYKATLQSLDSFAVSGVPDKKFYMVPGFHYRVHSMAMLALQKNGSGGYVTEYEKAFHSIYSPIPAEGREQVQGIYNRANTEDEKQKFMSLVTQYAAGGDSIALADAVNFIKQWNYWQVYKKTVPLAKKLLAEYAVQEAADKQNRLLGLDEGAVLSPTAKTFITNVTVIDVEKQKTIANATVGITGNMITSVTAKPKLPLPADAVIIDGKGQYLLPGLTDAHIHFFQSGGLYTRPDGLDFRKYKPYEQEIEWTHLNMKDVLKRNIQAGITTVIDVGATNNFLQLRDKFKGKSFAPAVYMTGPLLTTDEPDVFKNLGNDEPFSLVKTPAEARQMVQKQLPYHPDFIKIWYILENGKSKEESARKYLPVIQAIIDEAHKNNLKVAVHATERITAQLAVENGCDYLVHSVEDEIVKDDFLQLLKNRKVILCPTLTVYENYTKTYGQQHEFSLNEFVKANPFQLGSLYDLRHLPEQSMINNYKTSVRNNKALYAAHDSLCLVNLKKMVDAGVRIAAGTDAGNTGTLHGTHF